ncbi:MAG: SPOR domain-containing protein [Hyphomicrobium sp.]
MSPVHGSQGHPYARPVAQSQNNGQPQNQWGQPVPSASANNASNNGYAPAGYAPQPGQPGYGHAAAPQPQGQGYAGGYGQGQDYQFPQAGAPSAPAPRASSYAPQFEPFSPAPQRPHTQPAATQPAAPQHASYQQAGNAQGYAQQGYDYAALAQQQAPQPAYAPQAHTGQVHAGQVPAYAPQAQGYPTQGHPSQHPGHQAQTWGAPQHDPRGFDLGTYMPNAQPAHLGHAEPSLQASDWTQAGYQGEAGYADQNGAEYAQGEYAQEQGASELGFGQAAGGELDQGYADEEAQDYEPEAPARGRRPMMIAAVLAGAIFLGGGLTYGYKAILGGPQEGEPPVVKSAAAPSKVKPQDGGGKQFAHTDSKIMGRLGDGSVAEGPAAGEADPNGTRKVSTLVVGRDGSIQAPAAAPAEAPEPQSVSVPGMTVVDGLGPTRAPAAAAAMVGNAKAEAHEAVQQVAAQAPAPAKIVVTPPAAQKPVKIAKVAEPQELTGSIEADAAPAAPAAPAKPKKVKAAAAVPAGDAYSAQGTAPASAAPASTSPASASVATTGSGFVAVLASVPRTDKSRMDALKRFADMQQKYSGVLTGKTPDVAEANLGAKGSYHRLVVGPPGSREQASTVCSQLKSQGYADCWVTSY